MIFLDRADGRLDGAVLLLLLLLLQLLLLLEEVRGLGARVWERWAARRGISESINRCWEGSLDTKLSRHLGEVVGDLLAINRCMTCMSLMSQGWVPARSA